MSTSSFNILSLLTPTWAVPGTGLKEAIALSNEEFGVGALTPPIIAVVVSDLPGLFGDYPNSTDTAPSAIFLAVFAILGLAHLYIFLRNYSRGHVFWLSFGLAWYGFFRVIGFALRIKWATNVLLLNIGIASVVFNQVSVLYMNVICMILGHRIFTWRHPETGTSRWFNGIMYVVYFLVLGVIAMAIVGQSVPYLYFLDQTHLSMCQGVVKAAAILNLLYAMSGLTLVNLAYIFKPGSIDHRFWRMPKSEAKDFLPPTIQATWIESTGLFYFPRKGSQVPIFKDEPLSKAIRVMPSREPPASGLTASQNPDHHNGPRFLTAVIVVVVVSLILTMDVAFRVAAVFTNRTRGGAPPDGHINAFVFHNYVFYIWYGATEVLVNCILLFTRIDLRFYIPDMARTRKSTDPIAVPNQTDNEEEIKQVASGTEHLSDYTNDKQLNSAQNLNSE